MTYDELKKENRMLKDFIAKHNEHLNRLIENMVNYGSIENVKIDKNKRRLLEKFVNRDYLL